MTSIHLRAGRFGRLALGIAILSVFADPPPLASQGMGHPASSPSATGPAVPIATGPAAAISTTPAVPIATGPAAATPPRPAVVKKVAPANSPNIILILCSDQSAGMTRFEGQSLTKTPNLDRLAREGLHLTRCYTPTPMSAPTRASVLTGQYPHTHGVTTDGPALSPQAETFTARLNQAGYACGLVGKWQLPDTDARQPGFGLTDYVATDDKDWKWDQCPVWVQGQRQTADKFLTDWQGDRAIEFVEKFKSQPFFLWLCFRSQQPTMQDQLVYPPGTEQLYPPAAVDLPSTMRDTRAGLPPSLNTSKAATSPVPKNEALLREARSKYCAMVTRMDENVGRLLRRLDDLNLTEKTVVVFTSDGGFALGQHGLYGRGPFFYEEMIRCPLVVRYPRLIRPGSRCVHTVSLVDLAPTFCELAGLRPPMLMQGRSLLPLWCGSQDVDDMEERFLEYDSPGPPPALARGCIAGRYKFIRYARDNWDVLYDLVQDPDELTNVGRDLQQFPAYRGLVKVFQNRVDQWRKMTRDPAK